jgi:predicted alpha/beta superfamily hydrolase
MDFVETWFRTDSCSAAAEAIANDFSGRGLWAACPAFYVSGPMSQSSRFLDKWKARRRSAPGRLDVIPAVESAGLSNSRDVLIYLPASYDKTDKPYPVVYMHDGQNLFDPTTSFAGEWGVDTALARAPRKGRRAIVVGIPNAGIDRIREYSPFVDQRIGGGLGDAYLDWLEQHVVPLIDSRYRTIREPAGRGIVGSSLGGLISLYAFFRDPSKYGFVGAMSPALWFAEGDIFRFVESAGYVRGRIYLDVGTREGDGTLANARRMRDLLVDKGYQRGKDLMWVEDKGGMHNEAAWGRRLRSALPFLLRGIEER